MTEQIGIKQLQGMSNEQYNHLPPNGQVRTYLKELAELNGGY